MLVLGRGGVLGLAPGQPGVGRPDWILASARFALMALCTWVSAALTSEFISALGAANAKLRDLSQHDELTGLFNRRYIIQRMDAEIARFKRKPGAVALAMIDLDGFKRVNDELGHHAGDVVLKAVAHALLSATRKVDVVARYGGD